MKSVYYHGTSADNLKSIRKEGLKCRTQKLWNCSMDGIYLWSPVGVAEAEGAEMDEISKPQLNDYGFRAANESGQVACAKAKDCRVIVLKVVLDDEELTDDFSCPNMQGTGAKMIDRDILPHEIIEAHISNDLSLLRGYFISCQVNREYNNIEFTDIEKKVGQAFYKYELHWEDIEDMIQFKKIKL